MENSLQSPKRLTSKAKKILRARSHSLSPVVWVGKEGVDKVINEVKRQVKDKGLIKVKIRRTALERDTREDIAKKLASEADAEVVSLVGNVITLFRPREGWKRYTTKKIKKPKYVKEFEKLKFVKKFKGPLGS